LQERRLAEFFRLQDLYGKLTHVKVEEIEEKKAPLEKIPFPSPLDRGLRAPDKGCSLRAAPCGSCNHYRRASLLTESGRATGCRGGK